MTQRFRKFVSYVLALFFIAAQTQAATTNLSSVPLVTAGASTVLPNLMFILDDSGSMGWTYMPDWANDNVNGNAISNYPYLEKSSDYNGIYYNPAITYTPPTAYNSDGTLNTSTYPSQTSGNTTDWTAVKNDGYGVQSTSTSNVANSAYYYTVIPGEYCTSPTLRSCSTLSAATASYPYAAKLRWCNSSALTTCQAAWISGSYTYPRIPSPTTSTLTVSGSSSTSVTSITINGTEILSVATTASSTSSTVASNIATAINNGTTGYAATSSSSTVTIYAPSSITYTPSISKSGTMTISATAFAKGAIYGSTTVPGTNIRTTITAGRNSYPYPGSATKASTRSDCAGSTCTYAEEMTNFANWWAYYRTRMQMLKSSASIAFASLGSTYRVGFMSINNNTGSAFLNIDQFSTAQKYAWYGKLFASRPNNSTPLREALSNAGRIYAGKKNGTTFNGSTVVDPIQYSCQQNFTILSTDGYWNGNDGFQVDGSTAVGSPDSAEPRPFNDGGSVNYTKTTSQLQMSQTQLVKNTSQLQSRTQQIQQRTQQVQQQTQQVQKRTVQNQQRTQQLKKRTQYFWKCRSDQTHCSNLGFDCTVSGTGDSSKPYCMVGADSGWNNASSCTAGGSNPVTSCNTTDTGWVNAGSCTASSSGGQTITCQTTSDTGWVNASSCSSSNPSGGPTVTCTTSNTGWVNASSCTPLGPTAGQTVTCQTTDTGWVNASSCSASGPTSGRTVTCQTTDTGWVGASTCTAGVTGGQIVTCQTTTTGPTPIGSCTNQSASAGNSWTQTSCTTNTLAAATPVASCTASAASSSNSYVATNCNTITSTTTASSCTAASASSLNNYTTTTCSAGSSSGGNSDTLADVAEYYYVTDLRTSALSNCTGVVVPPATTGYDVCTNDVPTSGLDGASWQHMTTFTLGLGASGYMQFSPSYLSATSGDYFDVKNGTSANPSGGTCSWQSSGSCNWPAPSSDSQANIDDLWHAAVNGRGTYFSATDPASLSTGLSTALAGVSARTGAAAAATTSNPNVTSGDNFVFSSTFTTQEWDGELIRQQLDLTTGVVSATIDWAAQSQLDAKSSRTIYTYDAGAGNKLKSFAWGSLTAAEQAYFTTPNISSLSQFCASGVTCLSAASQTAAAGSNLVSFLRGDRTNEGVATDTTKYYRQRTHLLGDIVNAEAVYVKAPMFTYADSGYSDFITNNSSRSGMVYAASNDGMLHAFSSSTGAESWAYVPSMVMPNLYKLADKSYSSNHQYYVDGTPIISDIQIGSEWHTILVAGLNGGGRGYYALDVTDPSAPKALWEFTDTNLGYTYGNPEVAKLANGTWAVFVASGYNNVSPGDGVGRLYVLNAATGALIRSISTGVGSTTTPSGLARIRAWADNAMVNNTAARVYGGDNLGNVWRFDVNDNVGASGYDAQLLATLRDSGGTAQPITSKPELGECASNPVIFVGTGRFLGQTDLTDTSRQSFYAIKDALTSTGTGVPRTSGHFIQQTLTSTSCPAGSPSTICSIGQSVRTSTSNTVDFSINDGWFIDLPDSGERANTDPTLALGTLGFNTNVPNSSVCTAGGYSYRYFLNYCTGAPVSTSTTNVVSVKISNALATRGVFVRLPNNTVVQLTRLSDGTTVTSNVPIGSTPGSTRRVSWRELVDQ